MTQELTGVEAQVRWDRNGGRPLSVRWGRQRLKVIEVAAQRDEMAAYPAQRGPRITYLLETDRGRAALVLDGRRRRWYLEPATRAA
jgi:hypothetical protein